MIDDAFELYDLRVEVVAPENARILCNARVGDWYQKDKTREQLRAQTLHDIEHGGNENADIAAFVADRIALGDAEGRS